MAALRMGHWKQGPRRPPAWRPLEVRLERLTEKTAGCWLFIGYLNPHGYGRIGLGGKDGGMENAHRVAWRLAFGPIPAGMSVLHRCDNRACVRPDHLFLGTPRDNSADMVAKARQTRGTAIRHARLSNEAVQQIRAAYADGGVRQRDLAERYGVARTTVAHVLKGSTWTHVP